ncbi:MAG: ATP-grasp domain-containing protein [Hyphomicrobiales bacterium]
MNFSRKVVALEGRLRRCRNVVTLGVRPNFCDYGPEERDMIRTAETVYYPTVFYADLFNAAGKNTFPSYHTYKCVQDKIKQTALFELLGIPHPRTRVFYGNRQKAKICDFFQFPFIAKIPRGSARGSGVFLIRDGGDLADYCGKTAVAYIQEYLPIDRDMRIVVIGRRIVHAYWRIAPEGEFRSNVSVGGRVGLDSVPEEALQMALQTAHSCGWNDVGIDICRRNGSFYVLEANMKYGLEGFRKAGINYVHLLETMIEQHEI